MHRTIFKLNNLKKSFVDKFTKFSHFFNLVSRMSRSFILHFHVCAEVKYNFKALIKLYLL